jgi:hypothetical protein
VAQQDLQLRQVYNELQSERVAHTQLASRATLQQQEQQELAVRLPGSCPPSPAHLDDASHAAPSPFALA